ncbi:MAG: GNAT family N-acetyltransferase [Phenylobacterium sp.]|nr:GNAT family N-acetyltransferase [Phenylobacterium sp.]MBP8245651.1 GNAT family N-acetyltransferase [Phenylobacterium sp.]
MTFTIQPLGKSHGRAAFRCGEPELDAWFHKQAGQDERRKVARVFVAVDELGIAGFYSLGAFSLSLADLPPTFAGKLPRYDAIPAALIGRLARDQRVRGEGVGELLLADALRRVLGAGSDLGIFAILVDAKNDGARAFYESYGFQPFPSRPDRLFLLTATAAVAIDQM